MIIIKDNLLIFVKIVIKIYANIASGKNVFKDSKKLVGGAGTKYTSSQVDKEYARVDDPTNGKPGYFTLKTN